MEVGTGLLLLAAGLVAGFIDSQVGGGGAITLPTLMATGLPPHVALGTNKLVGTGASSMATANYVRAGMVPRRWWWLWPTAGAASLLGVTVVQFVPATAIRWLVVVAMLSIALYVTLKPNFGAAPGGRPPPLATLGVVAAMAGFYDGLLGPGTGTFLIFGFTAAGMVLRRAAAVGRFVNFASNVTALLLFAYLGQVAWLTGLPMLAGTIGGAFVGSRFNIRHGDRWLRPIFAVVTFALAIRLIM